MHRILGFSPVAGEDERGKPIGRVQLPLGKPCEHGAAIEGRSLTVAGGHLLPLDDADSAVHA